MYDVLFYLDLPYQEKFLYLNYLDQS